MYCFLMFMIICEYTVGMCDDDELFLSQMMAANYLQDQLPY